MSNKQKMALMVIHQLLVKQGNLMLAQALFHHLTGVKQNPEVANFLISLFESEM